MSATTRPDLTGGNGNRLAAEHAGPADGRPAVLLHGGGQTRHPWGSTLHDLAARPSRPRRQRLGAGRTGGGRGTGIPASSRPDRLKDAARALTIPTLLVRGRVSDLLGEDGAKELLELVPHAELVDVGGAGHRVAGDRNDLFNGAVLSFLDRLP